jgi:hypothetical protein
MEPRALFEILSINPSLNNLGINDTRIFELQSLDKRPLDDGYWLVINCEEWQPNFITNNSPRNITIWAHTPKDKTRSYVGIGYIMNAVKNAMLEIENVEGTDAITIQQCRLMGRSGNLIDPGWNTLTQNATFGVSYA